MQFKKTIYIHDTKLNIVELWKMQSKFPSATWTIQVFWYDLIQKIYLYVLNIDVHKHIYS